MTNLHTRLSPGNDGSSTDESMTTKGLEALAAVPPPRRTDAAFARSVRHAVEQRRGSSRLSWPVWTSAAAAAFGVVLMMRGGGPAEAEPSAPTPAPSIQAPVVQARTADLPGPALALGESDFAIPSLDGSTDEELAAMERALDVALNRPLPSSRTPAVGG